MQHIYRHVLVYAVLLTFLTSLNAASVNAHLGDEFNLTIASWNTQGYGTPKQGKVGNLVKNMLSEGVNINGKQVPFDIVMLQELRSGTIYNVNSFLNIGPAANYVYIQGQNFGSTTDLEDVNLPDKRLSGNNEVYAFLVKLPPFVKGFKIETAPNFTMSTNSVYDQQEALARVGYISRPPSGLELELGFPGYNVSMELFTFHAIFDGGSKTAIGAETYQLERFFNQDIEDPSTQLFAIAGDFNAGEAYKNFPFEKVFFADDTKWKNNIFTVNNLTTLKTNNRTKVTKRVSPHDKAVISKAMGDLYDGQSGIMCKTGGRYFSESPQISDHCLIWFRIRFASIDVLDTKKTHSLNRNKDDSYLIAGRNYIYPNNFGNKLPVYIINASNNEDNGIVGYNFREKVITGTINKDGTLGVLFNPKLIAGSYNIAVDVNDDGIFTPGIDAIDVFNEPGFNIIEVYTANAANQGQSNFQASDKLNVEVSGVSTMPTPNGIEQVNRYNVFIVENRPTDGMLLANMGMKGYFYNSTLNENVNWNNLLFLQNNIQNKDYYIFLDINQNGQFDYGTDIYGAKFKVLATNPSVGTTSSSSRRLRVEETSNLQSINDEVRVFDVDEPVGLYGENLLFNNSIKPTLYIVESSEFLTGVYTSIQDIAVWSEDITINSDQTFGSTWDDEDKEEGTYNLIFDTNGDKRFNPDIDVADFQNEPGFVIQEEDDDDDDDILEDILGALGSLAALFPWELLLALIGITAHDLPPNADVDIYLISQQQILSQNQDWINWQTSGDGLNLMNVAVPQLTSGQKKFTATTDSQGNLVTSIRLSDYLNDQALETYGRNYNIVIDVKQTGTFSFAQGDIVDIFHLNQLDTYFKQNNILDATSGANQSTIQEYNTFLHTKMDPSINPSATTFNPDHNYQYTCFNQLSKQDFQQLIQPQAQIGIRIIKVDDYHNLDQGYYRFTNTTYDHITKQTTGPTVLFLNTTHTTIQQLQAENNTLRICSQNDIQIQQTTAQKTSTLLLNARNIILEMLNQQPLSCIQINANTLGLGDNSIIENNTTLSHYTNTNYKTCT